MAQILGQVTGADSARVWLRVGGSLRPAASWPKADEEVPIPITDDRVPPMPTGKPRSRSVTRGASRRPLDQDARERPDEPVEGPAPPRPRFRAGLVLRNVRLIEELRASRRRLLPRKIKNGELERNIHDGAQQQLVALQVKQRLVEGMIERDPSNALKLMSQLQVDTGAALETLRDLARGVYPPLLADQGLGAALESQARKSPVPISVETDEVQRYPQDVEAAVYFCALEAMNNLAKYAGATQATVSLSQTDGTLMFAVSDDGVGFSVGERGSDGTGLQGMADRLDAIGGALEIRSAPGEDDGPGSGPGRLGGRVVGFGPRGLELVGPEHGLGDVRRRAALGGPRRVLLLLVCGEQEDDHGVRTLGQDLRGIESVDARQVHVHQDQVRESSRAISTEASPVSASLEAVGGVHHHARRQPERLLVVHDEHSNRHRRCPPAYSVPPGPRSDSDANTTVRMPELAYWQALRGAADPNACSSTRG